MTLGLTAQQIALIGLLLVARLGDIGSTWLATPNLKLESNPVVRKLRWWYAWATLLICFVPIVSLGVGAALTVASLLVTASNLSKGWLMRSLGEDGYIFLMEQTAARSSLVAAVGFVLGSSAAVALVGWLLLVTSGGEETWAYWGATGILLYAGVVAFYGTISAVKLFRAVHAAQQQEFFL
jgi:hypothetical protein